MIIGDNYVALQNLLISYKDKIDAIYIDPPYGCNDMGEFADTNYENAITRDNLLSMLYPRLILAKQLLSEDGVIFCSIDDRNYAYVKCLFDEIFNDNSVDTMIWRKSGVGRDGKMKNTTTFRKDHEYIIVAFKKNAVLNKIKEVPNFVNEYSNPDNDPRGNWMSGSLSRSYEASNPNHRNYYTVVSPSGEEITRQFEISKEEFDKLNADNRISWGKSGNSVPRLKIFVNEKREITPYSLLLEKGTTTDGIKDLYAVLNDAEIFSYPKPVFLIQTLLQLGTKEDSIVLDFFAGSGTTAQAVMELNREDGGTRKVILCTNNEQSEKNPTGIAYDVTSKRLKRVMTGCCYNGDTNFKWLENNEPYNNNLDVYDIKEVINTETREGKSAFEVINETLYDLPKFTNIEEKINWVCSNFENTQKYIKGE